MKKTFIIVVTIMLLPFSAFCQTNEPGKLVKGEVYIPKNIEECFQELNKIIRKEDREKLKKGEIEPGALHFGFGMGLRNSWGLWHKSRLARYVNGMGIHHPDDMSGIILESYVRYLRGEPLGLEKQVEYYQEYWRKVKESINPVDQTAR